MQLHFVTLKHFRKQVYYMIDSKDTLTSFTVAEDLRRELLRRLDRLSDEQIERFIAETAPLLPEEYQAPS